MFVAFVQTNCFYRQYSIQETRQ